ncbi:mechanosensitive ion channel family protein [Trueperella pyogenes]|uniref:mechanosensitive ion channel family protein n=1 Tax=Trueperella pyogenes TaxID=1661 RepID=UPI0021676070|nr:mechanosensitive ion channel family protein [Trueperella pyogenes]UVJ58038.1 mechanosensitive ion channel family protein [Trueperella pyogenes]WHU58718.1 mechanosensitive ion channel family protein [Trueperella pyogenes]
MKILALPVSATTDPNVGDKVDAAVEATFDAVKMIATIGVGLLLGLLAGLVFIAGLRVIVRRSKYLDPIYSASSRRLEVLFAVLGAWLGFHYRLQVMAAAPPEWLAWVEHAFIILIIVTATWVLSGLVDGTTRAINERVAEASEGRAARIKTQTQILRRVVKATVWILGMAGVLLTFPGARAAGASIFASAGIISVVAGLAAQTTLGNVFAGLQLAFTDSIRVGDIVMYEGNYTTVEEITLTYVVLAVWDGRRIIVPSTIMTTKSFENWTRRAPEMTGDVVITVDWALPIEAARMRFEQILRNTDLWDGRTGVLQVADASSMDRINLRCVVSAKNSPTLTDLRNHLREEMVRWIQEEAPQAIPHERHYVDEKGDLRSRNKDTLALVREREEDQPPVFEPVYDGENVTHTDETEIISAKEVAQFLRVSLADREAELGDAVAPSVEAHTTATKSAIFTGSPEAEERAKAFAGPGDVVYEERQRKLDSDTETLVQSEQNDAAKGKPDAKEKR